MNFEDLLAACKPGGASVLTSVTELSAAAGPHAGITPAKFLSGKNPTFAYETRFVDGEATRTVVIDSIPSSANRGEAAISQAIKDGDELLSRIPRIQVSYGEEKFTDLDLPHRFTDGHIRAGSFEGQPVTQCEWYRAMRLSTPQDYSAILNTSPISLVCGVWNSTAATHQVRIRRSITGETIGVLADQDRPGYEQQGARSGARVDPVGASVQLDGEAFTRIINRQKQDLSAGKVDAFAKEVKGLKKGRLMSGSKIGVGALPPSLDPLGSVSCKRIIRSWVLSFAAIRQLSFGGNTEQNAAGRALVAALAIALIARAEQELFYRSNCDLVEVSAPDVQLDQRYGRSKALDPFSVEEADSLLAEALKHAEELGVADWHGQVKDITGDPAIIEGAADDGEEEA